MGSTKGRKRVIVNDDEISFDSPKLSAEEKAQADADFKAHRIAYDAQMTPEQKLMGRLLQLKFQMEDYIKSDKFDDKLDLGYFLKEYIEIIHKKNVEFAEEIDVNPSELSQVIHKHRDPNSRLFIRLEIHSNKIFPALMWHKIFSKDKAMELLNYGLRGDEEKHVKNRLSLSF